MDDKNKGTTVNERLYLNGLFDEFYAAIHVRDIEKIREILRRVEITENGIDAILKQNGLMTPDS